MATEAQMRARAVTLALDPAEINLTETLQNNSVYWVLSGWATETYADDGRLRRLYRVEISEPKT